MEEIIRILIDHGAESGSGASGLRSLEVSALTTPMLRVSVFDVESIHEEVNKGPWPEKLPRDITSLSEEELAVVACVGKLLPIIFPRAIDENIGDKFEETRQRHVRDMEIIWRRWIFRKDGEPD